MSNFAYSKEMEPMADSDRGQIHAKNLDPKSLESVSITVGYIDSYPSPDEGVAGRPSSRTDRFARPASHLAADCVRPSSATSLNTSKSVFKPRKPVYLATFNVRSLKFRLRTFGGAEAAAAGYAGVGIVLSERAEASLLDWIPVDSRLCAVRLATSVRESRGSEVHHTLFIVSAYAPTDCSSESAKDSFYDALGALCTAVKHQCQH
ncbi:hypothetical protein CLF_102996 [Clonorchis sinensis]|uniref:Uncharacterized protein n=1 Tax=Clonorchis sinensis TaxID=79923 RepID=G7YNB8_CLOSI|nr:hypothetical protein CLF_102996 [Clonorchis sinensis]